MEIGALGDAVTGGLFSKVLSRPAGHAGEEHPACADCGTQTLGRFCHNCGNPSHVHRTLLHLGEELLHGVMHFDGRTWRTLPLLFFRPGRLTREWCMGKRARYVSPLAMFLFTVFIMFMALSYLHGPEVKVPTKQSFAQAQAEAQAKLVKQKDRVARDQADLAAARPERREHFQDRLDDARAELQDAQEDVDGLNKLAATGMGTADWRELVKAQSTRSNWNFNTGDKAFDAKLKHKLENPELFAYKLQQTFYKFSFLLVPLSIPFVASLFLWKRGFTLYDHGVFVLYSLTFVSTLILLAVGVFRLGEGWAKLAVLMPMLLVPVHMFFQLKGAYSLRTFSALWRTVMLLVFCNVVIGFFVMAVVYLGVA